MAVIPLSLVFVVLGANSVPVAAEKKTVILPCELAAARVEFNPDARNPPPVACVSPNTATVIIFHTPIDPQSVVLQGEGYFKVAATRESITVIPNSNIPTGQTFQLAVRFPDGAAPSSGSINLLANAAVATRQLDVFRRAQTVEAYKEEAREAREETESLREQLKEKEITCDVDGGLAGLILSGLLDWEGLSSTRLLRVPKGGRAKVQIMLHRLPKKRIAISAELIDPSYFGLEVAEVFLTDNLGTNLRPRKFRAGGKESQDSFTRVVAEWAVDERVEQRTFTLIFTINGGQTLRFENIRFP
jgi:uncharacterized protein (TIGR02268 family)